ncbi:acyltransferase family protein [Sphingomonas sp. Y38-1Y]|uniref:acyltransferase family protein n=1 Tax=Sphingomonas sp. Y38-1Y TaxID=3078265 RepID=UPI0028ED687A|nr:acyltransferase family protein [Sphingomonas sp. Y38-1Y]
MTPPSPARDATVPAGAARWMDALRGVLALVVAFSHGWGLIVADHRPGDALVGRPFFFLAGFAHPAVMLFFVLSGFWIAKSVASLDARGWSWRSYLTDRWSRLAIVIYPALVIGGLLDAAGLWWLRTPTHLGQTDVWFLPTDLTPTLSPIAVIGNFAFVQHILVHPLGSNGPLWSVAYEFWFYLWFAALWLAFRHRRPEPLLLTLALGLAFPAILYGFSAWLTGALAYHARGRLGARALVPLGVLLGVTLLWARMGDWFAEDLILAAAAALFVAAMVTRDPRFPRALEPLARFGASGSFSLYAIHFPIMTMAAGLIVGSQRLTPGVPAIAVVLGVLAAVLLIAILYARMTEARTPRLRAWLQRSRRPAQPAE